MENSDKSLNKQLLNLGIPKNSGGFLWGIDGGST